MCLATVPNGVASAHGTPVAPCGGTKGGGDTMEMTLGIILIALVALGIGMLAPVLSQLKRTLAVAEKRMDRIGKQVEIVLEDAQRITRRVDRLSEDLENAGVPTARLIESMSRLAGTLE